MQFVSLFLSFLFISDVQQILLTAKFGAKLYAFPVNLSCLVLVIWCSYRPFNFANTICCTADTVMMGGVYMVAFFLTKSYMENGGKIACLKQEVDF